MRIARRIQDLLTLLRRHASQVANRRLHHLAAIGRKAPHPLKQATRILLLRRGKVLPSFHPIQDSRLLLWRQRAEALQSLAQAVLSFWRQPAELRIAVQDFLLFLRRNIFVLAQPVSSMMLLSRAVLSWPILFAPVGSWPIRLLRDTKWDADGQNQSSHGSHY